MNPYKGDRTAITFLGGEIRAARIILNMLQTNRDPASSLTERVAKYLGRLEKTRVEVVA